MPSLQGLFSELLSIAHSTRSALMRIAAVFLVALVLFTALPFLRPSEFGDPRAYNWFSYSVAIHTLRWFEHYLLPKGETIIALGPFDAFTVVMYVGAGLAGLVTIPYATFVGFRYVYPGLNRKERRVVRFIVPMATTLFAAGCIFGLWVLPTLYLFAFQIQGPAGVSGTISIDEFVGSTFFFVLALGLSFEIPTVCYGLGYAGILTTRSMREYFRYVAVGAVLLAFTISPGVGGGLVELPIFLLFLGLYGLGYLIVRRVERTRASAALSAIPSAG